MEEEEGKGVFNHYKKDEQVRERVRGGDKRESGEKSSADSACERGGWQKSEERGRESGARHVRKWRGSCSRTGEQYLTSKE